MRGCQEATYQSVLRLADTLTHVLKELKPLDFIDIQSFIWFAWGEQKACLANHRDHGGVCDGWIAPIAIE